MALNPLAQGVTHTHTKNVLDPHPFSTSFAPRQHEPEVEVHEEGQDRTCLWTARYYVLIQPAGVCFFFRAGEFLFSLRPGKDH